MNELLELLKQNEGTRVSLCYEHGFLTIKAYRLSLSSTSVVDEFAIDQAVIDMPIHAVTKAIEEVTK